MKVVSVEEMRRIEAAADASGHTYAAMMERAGRAVAQAVATRCGVSGKQILILVGPGNNGGDGLVAGRYLADAGAQVSFFLLKPRDLAADENYRQVLERNLPVVVMDGGEGEKTPDVGPLVAQADVVVDALLGTGTQLPLRGRVSELLQAVRRALDAREAGEPSDLTALLPAPSGSVPERCDRPLLVGVDGPSGLDYDSGALDEAALALDLTVTFAHPKIGHFRLPGAAAAGQLFVADIGTDPALAGDVALEVANPDSVRTMLPTRPPGAHKGTFGRALVVAGSANYTGAAYLAAAAAGRGGAGLVTLALPAALHTAVAAKLSEATYLLLPHELGALRKEGVRVLKEHLDGYEALLIGPGLGQEQETQDFLRALLGGGSVSRRPVGFLTNSDSPAAAADRWSLPPLVIDADGLNILAQWDGWAGRLPPGTILTPHPGEMARLAGTDVATVQADRVAFAREHAAAWNCVVLLKGAYTVVAAPDGRTFLLPFANPGLAKAGTGDVLAGTIVGLRAQGLEPLEAAVAGGYLHGLAGELARQELGAAGMVAGDVLVYLSAAWQRLEPACGHNLVAVRCS